MAAVEVGGIDGRQLDLYRPLTQLARYLPGAGGREGFITMDGPAHAAGAAAGQGSGRLLLGRLGSQHGSVVVGRSFPLFKRDGSGGAGGQTIAQPVTVVLPGQFGLTVYHLDGALVAGGGTQAAAVAQGLVNFYDLAFHMERLLVFV